jgi:cell division septal protein FtsQ
VRQVSRPEKARRGIKDSDRPHRRGDDALCYGGWEGYRWLTRAELFSIAGVDVKGVRSMSDENIRGVAAMFTGQNVFRVDLGAATRRVIADPWVRDVRIERRLPNRISIFIVERAPKAVLQASNGKHLIDGEGVVMVPAGPGAPPLPVIALRDFRAVPREAATKGEVPEALELLDELASRAAGTSPA